ncbi:T9SS type A sorting domain-containing protein [Patiriisocius marinus]|uniref:T9SS type A sorting domain-containing protein n=1 Tax=Patiriisocius marinus TaxID=1397112 RepID=UPI00232F1118|nr:T9SS type A sorting domain-containing protein [Patiriisocius marinus]
MKFNYLLIAFALLAFNANAQFTFQDNDGVVYNDGDVYVTNSLDFSEASLEYRVFNSTGSDIFMKAELVSATGNDGADFEICFGLCYTGVTIGQQFPNNGSNTVPANGDSGPGNHMYHGSTTVDPAVVTEYELRFFQTTADGNTELGTDDFTIIYRYDPDALGTNDVATLNFDITSTIVSDNLEIRVSEDTQVTIFDLRGRIVKNEMITAGLQRINMSDLAAQAYIVQLKNNNNISETTKVIKR